MKSMYGKTTKGFTLVEVVVVSIIIGLLGIVLFNVSTTTYNVKRTQEIIAIEEVNLANASDVIEDYVRQSSQDLRITISSRYNILRDVEDDTRLKVELSGNKLTINDKVYSNKVKSVDIVKNANSIEYKIESSVPGVKKVEKRLALR